MMFRSVVNRLTGQLIIRKIYNNNNNIKIFLFFSRTNFVLGILKKKNEVPASRTYLVVSKVFTNREIRFITYATNNLPKKKNRCQLNKRSLTHSRIFDDYLNLLLPTKRQPFPTRTVRTFSL